MNNSTPQATAAQTSSQHEITVQDPRAEQTSAQASQGHIFGDTVVRDRAFAHLGNSYTSYHIYNTSDRAKPASFTVSDALTGLLKNSRRASTRISMLSNSSQTLREVQEEFTSLRIILSGLQRFIESSSSVSTQRAGLIELEDIVIVMTQLVLLYSEFDAFIDGVAGRKRLTLAPTSFRATAARLLDGLQRHKSTLSIILQILQCGPDLEAQAQASMLETRTEHQLRSDPALAERLLHLEPPENVESEGSTIGHRSSNNLIDTYTAEASSRSCAPSQRRTTMSNAAFTLHDAGKGSITSDEFAVIVAQSRVYRRVEHREIDAVSTCRSTRSHGWSILSGLSASQVTCVGVISLPLFEAEFIQFRTSFSASHETDIPTHASRHDSSFIRSLDTQESLMHDNLTFETPGEAKDTTLALRNTCTYLGDPDRRGIYGLSTPFGMSKQANSPGVGCLSRLKDELCSIGPDYPAEIRAGPVGNDIMLWQATIEGPKDTPYEGGTFSLRIEYPSGYPFRAPKFTFQTLIFHPNIDKKGNISLDVLGTRYTSALTTLKLLLSISSLLDDPGVDEPLVPEIAAIYNKNKALYDRKAREWTLRYARGSGKMRNGEPTDELLKTGGLHSTA